MSSLLEYKCPSCGGSVSFDAKAQKLKCPYCDSEFDVGAIEQEKKAIESGKDNTSWESPTTEWVPGETEGMRVYSCQSCGGEVVGDETLGASKCPYCDSPVIMKGQFSGALKPDLIIPFKYDKNAAKESLKKHIAGKKYVPKVFKDENHLDELMGVYVPYWLFSCQTDASAYYSAKNIRTWSTSEYNYKETSHYSVFRSGTMAFDSIPVDGSKKMDDTLMESIEPFFVKDAVGFDTAYLSGYLADKYDVTAQESMGRANERIKASATAELRASVDGYTSVTDKSSNINISNGSYKYALYPVWVLNTSWKGKKFKFAMNGQTGKFVGDLPRDNVKFWRDIGILGTVLGGVIYGAMWLIALL